MFTHHVPALAGFPAVAPGPRTPLWLRVAWQGARMIGELLLIAAIVMIVGHLLGDWLGVANPADSGTPGGPTATDIEAFTAIGAVVIGLALTGWRVVHGSLAIFAGALVFGVTLPTLAPMAALFAGLGAINFGGWLVEQAMARRHGHHDDALAAPPPRRAQTDRPKHLVGIM